MYVMMFFELFLLRKIPRSQAGLEIIHKLLIACETL